MTSGRTARPLSIALCALLLSGCVSGKRPTLDAESATAAADASTLFVPVVLSSSGEGGSFFTSELTLTNRGTTTATVTFTYTAASGGGSGSGSDTLAPGAQKIVGDAISYLRSRGVPIPDSGNRVGTLRVAFSGLSNPSAGGATVRTTTPVPAGGAPTGRAGLSYAGVPVYRLLTGTAWLCGLRQNASDRTNVAIQNAGSSDQGDVTIRLTWISAEGGSGGPVEKTLSPGGFQQYRVTDIAPSAANGSVKVERVSGTAPYYAYGVINDNVNSDGSFVTPLVESALLGRSGLTLPVVVETGTYSTEVVLTNFSGGSKQVTLTYVADAVTTGDHAATTTVTLAPAEQRIISGYVQYLRDHAVPGVGPAGATFVGSLHATVSGSDVTGLFLGARTSNPGGGGRYGLFYSAQPYGTAVTTTEAWLYGLQQNGENRTNLALLSTCESGSAPVTLRVELYDGATGGKVATVEGAATTLGPCQFTQLGAVLATYAPGVAQGYARVTRTSGQNGFVAYAVVNDGGNPGERSGDGAFVAMSVDTSVNVTFAGSWHNTTFGSTGAVTLVVSGDADTQLYSGTMTIGGNVFGGPSPVPQKYGDVFTLAGGTYVTTSTTYGTVTTTVSPTGQISGNMTNVPSATVGSATFTGSIVPPNAAAQTISVDTTINFRAGGSASCVTTLTRQP